MVKYFMVKPILQLGNKKLAEPSEKISKKFLKSREIKSLVKDLIDTANEDAEGTAGLSAVQIGVAKQIYIVRRVDLEEQGIGEFPYWEVMINPEVEVLGNELTTYWEGCMSIGLGDDRLFGPVERPSHIRVTYWDQDGVEQSLEAKDYMAHIIQHEQDHIQGILFLKHVKNPDNIWKSKEIDEYIEEHGTYPPILE